MVFVICFGKEDMEVEWSEKKLKSARNDFAFNFFFILFLHSKLGNFWRMKKLL